MTMVMTQAPNITRSSFDGLDLNDIVIFSRVVQHGSFTTAAKLFGKSPSYMSKHITQLENALSLTLLHRSTHHVFLTDAGSVFFDHCVRILEELEAAKADAVGLSDDLAGTLRVHSTPGVGQALVSPAIVDFIAEYPSVTVDLTISANSASLMERGVDVVVGSRNFDDDESFHSGLFERKLGPAPYVICAAPAYLERHPRPEDFRDLAQHNCLIHTTQKPNPRHWAARIDGEEIAVRVEGTFHSNLESTILLAAIRGSGVARLPLYSVMNELRSGSLISLFGGEIVSHRVIKAFYPRSRFVPKKLRAFLAILETRLAESVHGKDSAS
jgi:DNA-binding transcriptional LysR family regulator